MLQAENKKEKGYRNTCIVSFVLNLAQLAQIGPTKQEIQVVIH